MAAESLSLLHDDSSPAAAEVLRPVEVAQSHIVKAIEDRGVHVVRAAYAEFLGLAGGGAGDELVGHQYVPGGEIHAYVFNGHTNGVGVAFNARVGEYRFTWAGFTKGSSQKWTGRGCRRG